MTGMSMTTPHTLPADSDRGHILPHPDGRGWELTDFMDSDPLDPALRWNSEGVVVLPGIVPDELIDRYQAEFMQVNGPVEFHADGTVSGPKIGGHRETSYMYHEQTMEMATYRPIHDAVEQLLGEPPVVHLLLTGWVSTRRSYHQDRYLNPQPTVGDYYAACWVALDDVHPDSGPFEYYPTSHEWFTGALNKELMGQAVDLGDSRWPAYTEEVLYPLITAEAQRRGVEKVSYLPRRGDCLIWHGRTWHQGGIPNVPNLYRGAFIMHMSGSLHRPDFPYQPRRWRDAGLYMPYPEAISPLERM